MKYPLIFLALNLALTCFIAVEKASGQRLVEGSKPAAIDVSGFKAGYCSSLPRRIRICKVLLLSSDAGDAKYILEANGKIVKSFDAPGWFSVTSSPDGFVTYSGDLDNDGVSEQILVSFDGVSNGMGITYSTAYIFPNIRNYPKAVPISVPIEEFGTKDTFIFDKTLGRSLILVTYWKGYQTLDRKRGWGTYLVGKWFAYQRGRIIPLFNRPTLARRFLFRFQNERDNGWFANRTPYRWLQDKTTHHYLREPEEVAKLDSTELGVVSNFAMDSEKGCEVDIKTVSGGLIKGSWTKRGIPVSKNNGYEPILEIGIWKNRYLFPYGFDLSQSFEKLVGRRVRLERFTGEYGEKFSVLWIIDG